MRGRREPQRRRVDLALLLLALLSGAERPEDDDVRLCGSCGKAVEGETCCPEVCS
jgi:hypothetical protein